MPSFSVCLRHCLWQKHQRRHTQSFLVKFYCWTPKFSSRQSVLPCTKPCVFMRKVKITFPKCSWYQHCTKRWWVIKLHECVTEWWKSIGCSTAGSKAVRWRWLWHCSWTLFIYNCHIKTVTPGNLCLNFARSQTWLLHGAFPEIPLRDLWKSELVHMIVLDAVNRSALILGWWT